MPKIEYKSGRRPSYNINNSLRYLMFFKLAIEKPGMDLFIPAECSKWNVGVRTLQNRISEGLLWLTANDLEPEICIHRKEDFQRLRGSVKFRVCSVDGKDGVMLVFKYAGVNIAEEVDIKEIGISEDIKSGEVAWKRKLLGWIEEGASEPFILEGAKNLGRILTPSDIEWVQRTLNGVVDEVDVAETYIRAMR
jgi:hypothetical protein